jgi:hypothetical protein
VNSNELKELISDCPRLYHMAESGAFTGIKKHGLLSTSALLDLYEVEGNQRTAIESEHRPTRVRIEKQGVGFAFVRDQIPMSDNGLIRALPTGITPSMWYELLNGKVFFWLSEVRLKRLLEAKAYRDTEHEVLVLDTRSVIERYFDIITLCPINSGCTKPMPHPRDFSIFSRINDYPYDLWRGRRKVGERVVELCVDHSLPKVDEHLVDAYVARGSVRIGPIQ